MSNVSAITKSQVLDPIKVKYFKLGTKMLVIALSTSSEESTSRQFRVITS